MSVQAETYKKWVDSQGVVHYGSNIPPGQANRGYTKLNKHGVAIEHQSRAKTEQELARARELEILRAEQNRILEEQRAKDRLLLNMFRSEDDLILVRNSKFEQVNSLIRLKQKQIKRLKGHLANWQSLAEKRGGMLSEKQQENLDSIVRQIEGSYAYIADKEIDLKAIAGTYDQYLERFRELKIHQRSRQALEKQEALMSDSLVESAFMCINAIHCNQLWPHAVRYAKKHATTPVEVDSKRIVMTRHPRVYNDISITVSRISTDDVERIFLDVQCQDSESGNTLCSSKKVNSIRRDFRSQIEDKIR